MDTLEVIPDNTPLTIISNGNDSVEVIENPSTINFNVTFVPFYFLATQGQKNFVLSSLPLSVILFAINGIVQSSVKGDFSVSGATITTQTALNSGDVVAGVYV